MRLGFRLPPSKRASVFAAVIGLLGAGALPSHADTPRGCDEAVADLFERLRPAVVSIVAISIDPYSVQDRIRAGIGSGFVIDERGLIVTNSHVVFGAAHIIVEMEDGEKYPARLVGADPIFDVALLGIEPPGGGKLLTLEFGNSERLRPGEDAVAIGHPLALKQSVTRGVISGVNRILGDRPLLLATPFIQTDTPINPGNSGGPLLNRCGEVIGMNTAIIQFSQNVGFAVPSKLLMEVIPSLVTNGRIIRPWFGFQGQLVPPELIHLLRVPLTEGFLVEVVEPNSPAAEAGIQGGELPMSIGPREFLIGGDIVVEANGISVKELDRIVELIPTLTVGKTLKLKLWRNGETREVEYTLPERPLLPGDVPASQAHLLRPGR